MDIAFKVKAKNGILQDFIDRKGWTQSDFARTLGEAAYRVGRWFNMQDYPRSDEKMFRLSELVGRAPDEIFPDLLRDKDWLKGGRAFTLHREVELRYLPPNKIPQLAAGEEEPSLEGIDADVRNLLQTLRPREEKIIKMRMGIDGPPLSLQKVADNFGITPQAIRVVEARALRKLRHPSRARRLRKYIER